MLSKSAALRLAIFASLLFSVQASLHADSLFRPTSSYGAGGAPVSIAVGDANGDGYPDLAVASYFNGVIILLGNGNGTFRYTHSYGSGGKWASSVDMGDVNGDGRLDLVVANHCTDDGGYVYCTNGIGTLGVLLGNGDGTFQDAVSYASGGYMAFSVVVADVNGDRRLDLVVANSNGLTGLLGNGDGTFQTAVGYASSGGPSSIAVADVNSDGHPDLVAASGCTNACEFAAVEILLGNGDGTFQNARQYSSQGKRTYGIAVADVNGDTRADILVATSYPARFGVLLGNGDGTFRSAGSYSLGGTSAESIAVGDVNADGKPDLVTGIIHLTPAGYARVGVLFGNGNGTFQAAHLYPSGGYEPNTVAVEDLNGDSMPDVLVVNECAGWQCYGGRVGVLINRTPGFVTTTKLRSSPDPSFYGQTVTLKATVASAGPTTPTGRVAFWNGAQWLGGATLSGGLAVLQRKNWPAGTLLITAQYNGDPVSAKSTSPPITHMVISISPAP